LILEAQSQDVAEITDTHEMEPRQGTKIQSEDYSKFQSWSWPMKSNETTSVQGFVYMA
jgi:hypothetical protein